MKKTSLILTLIAVLGVSAFGQEIKPIRISAIGGAMLFGGSGIGLEYAIPFSKSTLGIELQGLNVANNDAECPWTILAGVAYYPFSEKGDGFFADIFAHYRFANLDTAGRGFVGATVGWRWIFLRFVNLGAQVGVDYLCYGTSPYQDSNLDYKVLPRVTFSAGVAF